MKRVLLTIIFMIPLATALRAQNAAGTLSGEPGSASGKNYSEMSPWALQPVSGRASRDYTASDREQDRGADAGKDVRGPYGDKRIGLALRTNLLIPLMNVGVEVPLSRHLSAAAEFYSPWLGTDRNKSMCIEAQAVTAELRWWIAPRGIAGYRGNTLTGHSVALGAFAGQYDFEANYSGFQGETWGAYLEYAYSFRIGEVLRLSLSLGVGYAHLPWREYRVWTEGGKPIRPRPVTENVTDWIGPVKAGVSLYVPLAFRTRERHQ